MNLPPQRATTAEKGLIFYLPPRFTFAHRKGIGHMPPGENVNSKGFQFPRKEATFRRPARRRSKLEKKKSVPGCRSSSQLTALNPSAIAGTGP